MKKLFLILCLSLIPVLGIAKSDTIVLSPDECIEVAILVTIAAHPELLTKADKMDTSQNSKDVARHILDNNDMKKLQGMPAEAIFNVLVEQCYGVQGETQVPIPNRL